MIDRVTQRPRARLDLLEQFVYLGEQTSVEMAERYLAAVEETCALLVTQPRSGTPYDSGIAKLAGLRRVPVKGFGNHLVFYIPRSGGVDVVRVLHAALDIESVFGSEES
jgi:plasmid stabilization system protein ParE